MIRGAPPAGYERITVGRCVVVTLAAHVDDARQLAAHGTLYAGAEAAPAAIHLQGRGIAYAIALPVTGVRAVVRHNRHGGLLAGATRDLFLDTSRAWQELATSLRLRDAGVRTPVVAMIGATSAGAAFRRVDVVTLEIVGSRDLSHYLAPECPAPLRAEAWQATRALVRSLDAAGARHHDLNVKNVLLSAENGALVATVLDVDRVVFGQPAAKAVRLGNARRLLRSARKWRDLRGAVFDEREITALGIPLDQLQ
jgi:3-deoxy-D-manno-octulosonic acid kinase